MIHRFIPEASLPVCVNIQLDAWFSLPYAGPLMWFNLRDISSNDVENENNGFGLIHTDYSFKEGFLTFSRRIIR
jgi:hypothetical protein